MLTKVTRYTDMFIGHCNMQMFAYAAKEHCAQHGTKVEHFAKIASKNRIHGSQNPRAAIQVSIQMIIE